MSKTAPEDFVSSRIRVHSVRIELEEVTEEDVVLCRCCGGPVDSEDALDGLRLDGRDSRVTSHVSAVYIITSEADDESGELLEERVPVDSDCAAQFIEVLGPLVPSEAAEAA